MSPARDQLLRAAAARVDDGSYTSALARAVAYRSTSQEPSGAPALRSYLCDELGRRFGTLGFEWSLHDNPVPGAGPFLVARRQEDDRLPTVLGYGHADVIRGQDEAWREGRSPWQLAQEGPRLYGRGTADNKGQHLINLEALALVLEHRQGQLGFNALWLIETGEETGSPGLAEFVARHRSELAADLLLASDGPRVHSGWPTVFLGSRGVANFTLRLRLRDGAHHSGNWGGLLRNPGTVLAHAVASLVDARGVVQVESLRTPPLPQSVRDALAGIHFGQDPGDPATDPDWGEPGLTPTERVIASNTLEVLAWRTGNPDRPVNAIPALAEVHLHMRFVVGTPILGLRQAVQAHLAQAGFGDVEVSEPECMAATRTDPDHPWVQRCLASLQRSAGRAPAVLPNLGGSLPNDVFADGLGLPTVWVPHSYPGCCQHAPDEHLLLPVAREGLQLMAGLYWDLGEPWPDRPARRRVPPGDG